MRVSLNLSLSRARIIMQSQVNTYLLLKVELLHLKMSILLLIVFLPSIQIEFASVPL